MSASSESLRLSPRRRPRGRSRSPVAARALRRSSRSAGSVAVHEARAHRERRVAGAAVARAEAACGWMAVALARPLGDWVMPSVGGSRPSARTLGAASVDRPRAPRRRDAPARAMVRAKARARVRAWARVRVRARAGARVRAAPQVVDRAFVGCDLVGELLEHAPGFRVRVRVRVRVMSARARVGV